MPIKTVSQRYNHIQWRRLSKELWGRPTTNEVFVFSLRQVPCTSYVCLLEEKFKTEECTCSQFLTKVMLSIKETETVDSVNASRFSSFSKSISMPNSDILDVKIVSVLNKIIHNSHFKRWISLGERQAQKQDRFLRGKQIAPLIYDYFQVTGNHDSLEYYADQFTNVRRNDACRIHFNLGLYPPSATPTIPFAPLKTASRLLIPQKHFSFMSLTPQRHLIHFFPEISHKLVHRQLIPFVFRSQSITLSSTTSSFFSLLSPSDSSPLLSMFFHHSFSSCNVLNDSISSSCFSSEQSSYIASYNYPGRIPSKAAYLNSLPKWITELDVAFPDDSAATISENSRAAHTSWSLPHSSSSNVSRKLLGSTLLLSFSHQVVWLTYNLRTTLTIIAMVLTPFSTASMVTFTLSNIFCRITTPVNSVLNLILGRCHILHFWGLHTTIDRRSATMFRSNQQNTHTRVTTVAAHTFLCDFQPNNKLTCQLSETTHKLRTREDEDYWHKLHKNHRKKELRQKQHGTRKAVWKRCISQHFFVLFWRRFAPAQCASFTSLWKPQRRKYCALSIVLVLSYTWTQTQHLSTDRWSW